MESTSNCTIPSEGKAKVRVGFNGVFPELKIFLFHVKSQFAKTFHFFNSGRVGNGTRRCPGTWQGTASPLASTGGAGHAVPGEAAQYPRRAASPSSASPGQLQPHSWLWGTPKGVEKGSFFHALHFHRLLLSHPRWQLQSPPAARTARAVAS